MIKPTKHELYLASQNGGKLPKSFQERKKGVKKETPVSEEKTDNTQYPDNIDVAKAKKAFSELEDPEFPQHWYGKYFFLSDGSVIGGKQDAIEAQNELS